MALRDAFLRYAREPCWSSIHIDFILIWCVGSVYRTLAILTTSSGSKPVSAWNGTCLVIKICSDNNIILFTVFCPIKHSETLPSHPPPPQPALVHSFKCFSKSAAKLGLVAVSGTLATLSKARTLLETSNTGIVCLNPARGVDVCVCALSVFVLTRVDRVEPILRQRSSNKCPKFLYLEVVSEFEEVRVSKPWKSKSVQILGTISPGWLHFVRWCIIRVFVCPQYGTCCMSPLWRI